MGILSKPSKLAQEEGARGSLGGPGSVNLDEQVRYRDNARTRPSGC